MTRLALGLVLAAIIGNAACQSVAAPRAPGAVAPASSSPSVAATAAPGCRHDRQSPYIASLVRDVFTSPQPDYRARRVRYQLPEGIDTSEVLQVTTDRTVCERVAALHYATILGRAEQSPTVFVFRARAVYVVVDPKDGEHYMLWTFLAADGRALGRMGT